MKPIRWNIVIGAGCKQSIIEGCKQPIVEGGDALTEWPDAADIEGI